MDGIAFKQRVRTISQPLPASNISFRHPGYDDPEDILFTLPRLDSSDSQAPASGVLHGTALLACQIIANNAFDGYLTTDRGGNQRVSVALDGVLMDDDYWFVVPDTDVYPVVPRFQEWQFPHGHLEKLAAWDPKSQTIELHVDISTERPTTMTTTTTGAKPPSMLPPAVPAVPRCVLTNNPYAIQKTHIVPVAQSKWFQANSMKRYGDQQLFINTEQNMVPIRHDLHKLWDDHVFALVPKRAADGNGSAFVVHVLNMPKPPLNEFANEWHNTPVQKGALDQAGKAFLLAKYVTCRHRRIVLRNDSFRYAAIANWWPPFMQVRTGCLHVVQALHCILGGASKRCDISSESRQRPAIPSRNKNSLDVTLCPESTVQWRGLEERQCERGQQETVSISDLCCGSTRRRGGSRGQVVHKERPRQAVSELAGKRGGPMVRAECARKGSKRR